MNINNLYELLKENDTQKLKDFINDKTLVNEDARVISIYLIYYNNNIIEELIKKVLDINLKYPKIYVMEILINFAIDKKRYDFLIPFFKCVPNLNLLEFYKIRGYIKNNKNFILKYNDKYINLLSILYYRNIHTINLLSSKKLENIVLINIKKNIQENCEKILNSNLDNYKKVYEYIIKIKKSFNIPDILLNKIFKYDI
jgi:hypothetical protein